MRRRFGLEIGLGLGLVLGVGWLVLGSEERERGRDGPRGAEERTGAAEESDTPLEVTALMEPPAGRATDPLRTPAPERARVSLEPEPTGMAGLPVAKPGASSASLEVLVLTAGGTPAPGVPLSLEVRTEPPASGPVRSFASDSNGRVSIPLGSEASWNPTAATILGFVLRTRLALRGAPEIDLGPDRPVPQALTLRLPPAGTLRLQVLDPTGEPVESGASVYVRRNEDSLAAFSYPPAEVSAGWATVPWVDLGLTLDVRATLDGMRGGDVSATVPGPTREGEAVEATLRLKQGWPEIAFRAVDEYGTPLGQVALGLRVTQEPLSPQDVNLRTDPDGRATFLHYGRHRPEHARMLEVSTESTPLRCTRVALDNELESAAPTDLGDVVLAASESVLLASGTVRDERAPLAGAVVTLKPLVGTSAERRQTTADALGHFEFRGLPRKGPFRLSARAERHMEGDEAVVEAGTSGVVLALTTGAFLAIAPLPDDPLWTFYVDVRLISAAGDGRSPLSLAASTAHVPGRYDLELRTLEGFLLDRVENVVIRGGQPPDPRLNPLDLRRVATRARFRLLDGSGQALAERHVRIHLADEDGVGRTDHDGVLQLLLPSRWSRVELVPEGHTPVVAAVTDVPQELVSAPR